MAALRILAGAIMLAGLALHAALADAVDDCRQGANPELAIGACTEVIRSGDYQGAELAWAFNNRGLSYADVSEIDRAVQDYDQAIALDPNHASAFNNRGNAYKDLGNFDQAMRDYNRALAIDPVYATAYYNRGILHRKLRDPASAVRDYDQAIRHDPAMAVAYHNRGNAHEDLGNEDAALRDWEKAIELEGASRVRWWQAWTRDHGGHYQGKIDGVYGSGTRAALIACAKDPDC